MPKLPAGTARRDLSSEARALTLRERTNAIVTSDRAQRSVAMDRAAFFSERPFGPGSPIAPTSAPDSAEQTEGPRQFQFPVGINQRFSPRGDYALTPFEQLRNLATLYDVAALCIATRIETMLSATWGIVAKDKRRQQDVQDTCDAVTEFWEYPDRVNEFSSWLSMALYDLFSIDALAIYKRPDRSGDLYGLELVDGSTIKPLADDRGRTLAYQQVIWGYPVSEYGRPYTDEEKDFPTYSTEQLIYRPRWVRTYSPYGFPPTEWIILRVNTALRKQTHDLAYFTDGNIPDMLISPPEGTLNPDQVRNFEEWFNSVLVGDDQARRKARFLAWAANVKEMRPFNYTTELDLWMLRVTCASYSVQPQEIGFTHDSNKATAEFQENLTHQRGFLPLSLWLKGMFDRTIHQDLDPQARKLAARKVALSLPGRPTQAKKSPFALVEWQWQKAEKEDSLMQAQTDKIYYDIFAVSNDELRSLRFGDVLEGPAPVKPPPVNPFQPSGAPPAAPGSAGRNMTPDDAGGGDGSMVTQKLAKRGATDDKQRAKDEEKARAVFGGVYDGQQQRIKAVLRTRPQNDFSADWQQQYADAWDAEPQQIAQEVLPLFDELLAAAAERGLSSLTVGGADWTQINQAVLQIARDQALGFGQQTSDSSQRLTDQVIADWIATGGTMSDLIDRVSRVWTGPRPDVAAVTSVTDLYSEGQYAAWAASGVVTAYNVVTANDGDVDEECQSQAQGGPYDIDDKAHLPSFHFRCRCDISPVVEAP